MITLVLFLWSLPVIFWIERVLIPYIAHRIEVRRWRKLHPNMPSWRRVRP